MAMVELQARGGREARRATQVAVCGEAGWRESQKIQEAGQQGGGGALGVRKAWLKLQLPIFSACVTLSKTVSPPGRPALA